jgi:mono/diheme cytochrome c family protein
MAKIGTNLLHRQVQFALGASVILAAGLSGQVRATPPVSFEMLADHYSSEIRPIVVGFCVECHSTAEKEGELDLERFASLADVRRQPRVWQKVAEMLNNGEMPPQSADQPSPDQRRQLRGWVEQYLDAEAHASAGDPGPVVLRRLNNAQLTYTVRDLTGIDLQPARQFPADGAAGEGFTNAGGALAMSPSLLTKYLDAGKEIATHAVLLPEGMRFSAGTTRRDFSDEIIERIKKFYSQFADGEGRLPLDRYLAATLEERDAMTAGTKTPGNVAAELGLNAKYFVTLWNTLNADRAVPSLVLDSLQARWRVAKPGDAAALIGQIAAWQKVLSRFQNVGHMKPWLLAINPLTARHDLRFKIPEPADGKEVTVYLSAADAGDGATGDVVVWQAPRLVTPGRPDLLLRDVRDFTRELVARRQRLFASAARCLAAAAEASVTPQANRGQLAERHGVDADSLAAWLDYLGIGDRAALRLDHLTGRLERSGNYDFVKGWGTPETPSVVANSSDQQVRIPGNMKPHGVVVHPSPTSNVAAGWQSPLAGQVRINGKVTHAHPECGNGVAWSLEWRRGKTRQRLATGIAHGANSVSVGPIEQFAVQPGDLVSLVIGPRDGNHACDLTDIELVVQAAGDNGAQWSLTHDVSGDVLSGNPHADRLGNLNVWHFYTEPIKGGETAAVMPAGSLLARWQSASAADEKQKLADDVQKLLVTGPPADKNHADAVLYRQLASLSGPLFAAALPRGLGVPPTSEQSERLPNEPAWGLDPARFGRLPDGSPIDAANLCVQAPSVVAIRLPADLVAGCELVTSGVLQTAEGSVQLAVQAAAPASLDILRGDGPVLVAEGGSARKRFEAAFDEFRRVFPAALCYSRVVPVDEVITLAQFHREDGPLCQLMLDDDQRAQLDRLWNELHFVSRDALTIVDSYAQLMEYATQDSDPRLFEPLRKPIHEHAAAFRQRLVEAEPKQLDALVDFAGLAYRRPLAPQEAEDLRGLYRRLRERELSHEEAFQLTLARVFVAPAFLYRLEAAPSGKQPGPVSNWELANRLSYFLWSSLPDTELREVAATGRLVDPNVLAGQARRMLADAPVRRLATEFACQWLHIYEFDTLDEKSERHFPSFVGLRGDMYEEAVRFFTDLFQRDGSVLEIWNADYLFVNEALARHYGIPGVTGGDWRRIDDARQYGRGGILGFAATLAKQSGASRTSPILRGNWISEALLGERLPRPPKDVPRLPEDETATEGLTVRQLVEKHTSDPRCATCHAKIDPLGFSLEGFDAIGGRRDKDLSGRPIDTHAKVADGAAIDGLDGLREYLLTARRAVLLRQFCKKLLGYALGRGVQLSDSPLLSEIEQALEQNDYRFSAAVETIVRSRQFREIRGRDALGEL